MGFLVKFFGVIVTTFLSYIISMNLGANVALFQGYTIAFFIAGIVCYCGLRVSVK